MYLFTFYFKFPNQKIEKNKQTLVHVLVQIPSNFTYELQFQWHFYNLNTFYNKHVTCMHYVRF